MTYYYRLKAPVTSLRVERNPRHTRITVFVRHEQAGTLTVPTVDAPAMISIYAEHAGVPPLRTLAGGAKIIVSVDPMLPDETQVVSAYGELTTVGAVKALAGQGAKK